MTRARRAAAATIALAAALALGLLPAAAASAVPLPTFTVSGTIEDSNGVGLVGATYSLRSGSGSLSGTSTTGGAFSISNVPAGDYAATLFTGTSGYAAVHTFATIPVGGISGDVLVLPRSSEAKGIVTDASNNPVAGVLVAVSFLDSPFGGTGVSNGGDGTMADGKFDFFLDSGRNIISYSPPDGSDLEYQWYSDKHTAADAFVFNPAPDGAGSPFDASVQLATNTDQATGVVTLDGVAVTSGFAYLYDVDGVEFAEVRIGADGTFKSAGLPDGDYTIQAHYFDSSDNAYISQMQPFTVNGGDVTVANLVLVTDPGTFAIGVADSYSTAQNTVLSVPAAHGLTSNDTRTPPGEIWAVVGLPPAHGQVFLQFDGALTYAPDDGFVGTDTFSYRPSVFYPFFGASGDLTTVSITVGGLPNTGVDVTTPVAIALLALIAGLAIIVVRRRQATSD